MSVISIILVLIIAFLAGLDGILDQFQFHQPLVSCTLIGLASGHTVAGIMLGGTLQFLALGWANIGAAVAPDVALASTAAAVIMIKGGDFSQKGITIAYGVAVPLAIAGLALTMEPMLPQRMVIFVLLNAHIILLFFFKVFVSFSLLPCFLHSPLIMLNQYWKLSLVGYLMV